MLDRDMSRGGRNDFVGGILLGLAGRTNFLQDSDSDVCLLHSKSIASEEKALMKSWKYRELSVEQTFLA